MKILISIPFIILSYFAYSQHNTIVTKDFNKDGFIDTLLMEYRGGSGFGGQYVTVMNGKTKEKFELNSYGCFCDIKRVIPVPPTLLKESNLPFLNAVAEVFLPEKRQEPDPSLEWIMKAYETASRLKENPYYDLFIDAPVKWNTPPVKMPETYYIDLKSDQFHRLYSPQYEYPEWYDKENTEGWLIYYGHNHTRERNGEKPLLTDQTAQFNALNTAHGVIIENSENMHAWIFTCDYMLTGGPDRLRRESIIDVKLHDTFAVIRLN